MTDLQRQAVALVHERGYERREQPFVLASGMTSRDYIDGKRAVERGDDLLLVSRAVIELARRNEIVFDTVGGLTMGADAIAHGISIAANCVWFSVRKERKSRGLDQWIEGHRLQVGDRALLVDDVVTMGGSIQLAYQRVVDTGAIVVGVIPMVDRGDNGAPWFAEKNIPYIPLMTYRDLGIEAVGGPQFATSAG